MSEVIISIDTYTAEAITEAEAIALNTKTLVQLKIEKSIELEALCEIQIVSGFASSALGSEHWYKSGLTDQLNIVGVVAGGADSYFKAGVKDTQGIITWDWILHTAPQLKTVLGDGAIVKVTLLQKLTTLKAQVESATTQTQIDAIAW